MYGNYYNYDCDELINEGKAVLRAAKEKHDELLRLARRYKSSAEVYFSQHRRDPGLGYDDSGWRRWQLGVGFEMEAAHLAAKHGFDEEPTAD